MARISTTAVVAVASLALASGFTVLRTPFSASRPAASFSSKHRQNSALRMSFLPEGWDSSPTANQHSNSKNAGGMGSVGGGLKLPRFNFRVNSLPSSMPKLHIVDRIRQSLRCIRPGMMRKRSEEFFLRQAIFFAVASTADATIAALPHALPSWLLPLPAATLSMGLPLSVSALLAQSIAIDLTFSFWACSLDIKASHEMDKLRRLETMLAFQDCQEMVHVTGSSSSSGKNRKQPAQAASHVAAAASGTEAAQQPAPSFSSDAASLELSFEVDDALVKPPEPAIVSAAAYARVSKEFALDGHGCEYGGDGTWRCS